MTASCAVLLRWPRSRPILRSCSLVQVSAASASQPSAAALQPPDRVTVSWLIKHVPAGVWMKAAGVLAVAFVLGAATYRSGFYAPLETWIKSTLD